MLGCGRSTGPRRGWSEPGSHPGRVRKEAQSDLRSNCAAGQSETSYGAGRTIRPQVGLCGWPITEARVSPRFTSPHPHRASISNSPRACPARPGIDGARAAATAPLQHRRHTATALMPPHVTPCRRPSPHGRRCQDNAVIVVGGPSAES